jgi:hypothetical protein
MSDLHVVSGNEGFGLIDHIKALDERIGKLEILLAEKFPSTFVYTEGWDKGFADRDNKYGITEYTDQSANPDAHRVHNLPTQADADRITGKAWKPAPPKA